MFKTYKIDRGFLANNVWHPFKMKARSRKDFIARYNNLMKKRKGYIHMDDSPYIINQIKEISI